jgi:hypothetical protein
VDWASVVLAGISGALGAAVAYFFIRNPRERRTAYIVVFISSFAIFDSTFRVFLLPHIQVWQYEEKVDQQLQEIPAYQAIQESDPRSYDRIREIVHDGIRDGQGPDIVASRIRGVISELVVKYIPHASDDAVIDLARVMVREIEQLTRVSPNVCYQFLFPEQYGCLDLGKYIDTKTRQDDLAALATLIRTATYHPQPEPDACFTE